MSSIVLVGASVWTTSMSTRAISLCFIKFSWVASGLPLLILPVNHLSECLHSNPLLEFTVHLLFNKSTEETCVWINRMLSGVFCTTVLCTNQTENSYSVIILYFLCKPRVRPAIFYIFIMVNK